MDFAILARRISLPTHRVKDRAASNAAGDRSCPERIHTTANAFSNKMSPKRASISNMRVCRRRLERYRSTSRESALLNQPKACADCTAQNLGRDQRSVIADIILGLGVYAWP